MTENTETKNPPEAEAAEPVGAEGSEERSAEDLKAELERLREEVKNLRRWERKAKRLEQELQKAKPTDAEEAVEPPPPTASDAERVKIHQKLAEAQARIAALEQERVDILLKAAVVAEASKLGFEYPEDVWRVVDRASLEYDDETGEIHGVEEAVKEVAKKRPRWLRGAGVGVGNAPGAARETDEQKRARLLGGGGASPFWKGGGVILPED